MLALAAAAALAWCGLLLARGRFWQAGPALSPFEGASSSPPLAGGRRGEGEVCSGHAGVVAVVPARDEAAVIGQSLGSLLAQDYARLRVVLVDDGSSDGTGAIARALGDSRLTVLAGRPPPAGWSGKLWAVAQGVAAAGATDYLLLTDADIVHEPGHLALLVAKAEAERLDMVSEMVRLGCASGAERLLVPAFVYFFQLLYPFSWVNDPRTRTAAAAGGTMLVRRAALERIGGVAAIRGALIDDVALARALKRGAPREHGRGDPGEGRIWLGHSRLARSLRAYPRLADVWEMIARSAFVQLRYSWGLLGLTVLGMTVVFVLPPLAALFGTGAARWLGVAAWVAESASYLPTLRRFRACPLRAPLLPAIAAFYVAATIGSALRHGSGRGVVWKGRTYRERQA